MPEHEDVEPSEASDVPRPEPLRTFFRVDEICREDGRVRYVGESYIPERTLLRKLVPEFRDAGYDVDVETVEGATPSSQLRSTTDEPESRG